MNCWTAWPVMERKVAKLEQAAHGMQANPFIPAYVRVASVEPEEKTVAVLVRNESRNQEPEAVRSRSKRSDAETRPNEVPKG
jgi:hypothetical protein